MNATHHPWVLTGPWYRWADPYDLQVGRTERPVFQKYATSDLVNAFLADPQHSLKFLPREDEVAGATDTDLPVRKLYLDTHQRFYLVVCELHCDVAGFPNTSRDAVCEAGFVIRRRVVRGPQGSAPSLRRTWQSLARSRAHLSQFEELPTSLKRGRTLGLRADLESRYTTAQTQLATLARDFGLRITRQGWIPGDHQGVGSWDEVEATPASLTEQVFPLYPLVPDPTLPAHSSGGRTLYFGLVPTGSSDTDATGSPRFDDRSLYEIRCYVRRHCPRCPKRRERNDCPGELVWSQPTEPYQLAAPFDLLGTSHRPINIVLPDIAALEEQTRTLAPGQGAPVRLISPPSSCLEMKVNPDNSSDVQNPTRGTAICSFSIPLITIVASFVFRLFLPVVVFLFGLWFLLKIKFCIPPSIDLGAGLAADFDAAVGGIDWSVDFDIDLAVDATLLAQLELVLDPTTGLAYRDLFDTSTAQGRKDLVQTIAVHATDFSQSLPEDVEVDPAPAGAPQHPLPEVTVGLEYEAQVEVKS